MGECLIVRRGGESYELPVLDASCPKDVTVTAAANGSATFSVSITTPGRPAEYTYQWYKNGAAVSGGTAASLTLTGLTAAATYSIYCKVTNKAGSVNSRAAVLTVQSYLPAYTYSGSAQLIDDGNYNWRLKLFTSGKLTFSHLGSGASAVDVFLVGGGGGGGSESSYYSGGGGGGYTKTVQRTIQQQSVYQITIGAGGSTAAKGGTTSALNATADGGFGADGNAGGAGGSGGGSGHPSSGATGGAGGSDGNNGASAYTNGGAGQGTTTREFGEASGALYAGGGGGSGNGAGGAGGDGGGGKAANPWGIGNSGTPNTGGGSGGNWTGGNADTTGGSGIVIIRNHR